MKNFIIVLLIGISLISCNKIKDNNHSDDKEIAPLEQRIALKFINDYVDNCNKLKKSTEITQWTKANSEVSARFKKELIRIVDNAYKEDPELGLDFDPIFDAQDYPEGGFEIESVDNKSGYLILKGKDMNYFKLTMKMIRISDKWLVDGCGIVNIPEDKRIKR